MKLLASLRLGISTLLQRSQVNAEIEDELRSHIQHRADDLERSGLSRPEAERRARVEFGGYQGFKEECHKAAGGTLVESLLQDLRYALRLLRKSPAFTAVAVVTLALGIGANAVVFSVLNALILRPLNVPHSQDLFMIEREVGKGNTPQQSYPDYVDLRDRNRSFDGLIAYTISPASLNITGNASSIWLYGASGNYFDVLGVQPYLGRFFHASDEHGVNSAAYIVLSYAYWQSHLQGDPGVVGHTVQLNEYPYTILGIAPPNFRGSELFFAPDLWAPLVNQQQLQGWNSLDSRAARSMWLVGRLKAGKTPAQATAELSSIASTLARDYPNEDDGIRFHLARPGLLGDALGGPVRAFVGALMLLAGLILLAACANLGSLFAARAADRSKEVALRLALGSSPRRIVRQLLTEAVLVSLAGGALGLFGGVALLRWLSTWQPVSNIPINVAVNPDAWTYFVALLLALVSGLLFGMVPVRQVFKAVPYHVIKASAAGASATRRLTLRDLLLAGQITVCAVLVTASLVAVRGLVRSLHSNFGFQPQNAWQVGTDLDMGRYSGDQVPVMQRRMLEAVAGIPGVTAAGYADRLPLNLGAGDSVVYTDSTTDYRLSNGIADAMRYQVSPGYFEAAATTLLSGRTFTWHDDKNAPHVAVVNQEFARRVFGSIPKAVGGYFKIWDGGACSGGGHRGERKILYAGRKPAAGNVPAYPAIAVQCHLAGGAIEPRSAGADGSAAAHLAHPGRGTAVYHQHLDQGVGYRPLRAARGYRGAGRARWHGSPARHHRHLRDGGVLGKQEATRARHPHRSRRAA
jgi:predicted permease